MITFEQITPALIGKRVQSDKGAAMGWTRSGIITSVDETSELPYTKTLRVKLDETVCNGYDVYDSLELFCRHDNGLGSSLLWTVIEEQQ